MYPQSFILLPLLLLWVCWTDTSAEYPRDSFEGLDVTGVVRGCQGMLCKLCLSHIVRARTPSYMTCRSPYLSKDKAVRTPCSYSHGKVEPG